MNIFIDWLSLAILALPDLKKLDLVSVVCSSPLLKQMKQLILYVLSICTSYFSESYIICLL